MREMMGVKAFRRVQDTLQCWKSGFMGEVKICAWSPEDHLIHQLEKTQEGEWINSVVCKGAQSVFFTNSGDSS